jgi:hypothetical protein
VDGSLLLGNFGYPVAGHRVINGGMVPNRALPFSTAYFVGNPDIGAVEWRSGWHLWRAQQYGEENLSAAASAAAAPAADGHSNALHYLLGVPIQNAIPSARLPRIAGPNLFRWERQTTTGDATVDAVSSQNLVTWAPVGSRLLSTTGNIQTWETTLPNTWELRRFFQLQIRLP